MVEVRQATADDWRDLKYIRLKALKVDPLSFGSNYTDESQKSDDDWQKQVTKADCAIFLVYDGNIPVGMTAVGIDVHDKTKRTAFLWGSWLEPRLRGQGISKKIYQQRITWVEQHPTANKIIVACRESNRASQHVILSHEFLFTHGMKKTWPDGVEEKELFYKRDLKL